MAGAPYNPSPAAAKYRATYRPTAKPAAEPSPWETFTSAALQAYQKVNPLGWGALQGAAWVGDNVISRPLSTAVQATTLNGPRFMDWSGAWDASEEVSPGQAVAAAGGAPLNPVNLFKRDDAGPAFMRSGFDPADDAQRKAAFEDDWLGRVFSGGSDAILTWYMDPLVIAGKGAKVARSSLLDDGYGFGAERTRRAAQSYINESGGFYETAKWFNEQTDAAVVASHKFVKNSSSPDLLAGALADSRSMDETVNVLMGAMGDQHAMGWLAKNRAAWFDGMLTAQREVDELAGIIQGKAMLYGVADAADEAAYGQARAVLKDYTSRYEYFNRVAPEVSGDLGEGVGGVFGASQNVPLSRFAKVEARRGRVAERDAANRLGTWRVETFQGGAGQRMVRTWQTVNGETPSGWVATGGLESQDAGRELIASFRNLKTYRGYVQRIHPDTGETILVHGSEDADRWFGRWARAASDAERRDIALQMENQIGKDVLRRFGYTDEAADEFLDLFTANRDTAMKTFQREGFIVDEGGSILRAPQLQSQLAETLPMLDFKLLEKVLEREAKSRPGKIVEGTVDTAKNLTDMFYAVWRPAVLLRLGYTQRNVIEGSARSLAYLGTTGANPFTGLGRIARNAAGRTRQATLDVRAEKQIGELRSNVDVQARLTEAARQAVKDAEDGGMLPDEIDALRVAYAEQDAALAEARDVLVQTEAARLPYKPRKAGQGKGEAFADEPTNALRPDVARALSSSDMTIAATAQGAQRTYDPFKVAEMGGRDPSGLRLGNDWVAVTPDRPQYVSELTRVANRQFRNDPLIRRVLNGEQDQQIAAWLRTSEGRQYLRSLDQISGVSVDVSEVGLLNHVRTMRGHLDRYLPDSELRTTLASRELRDSEVSAALAGRTDLAPVHGRDIIDQGFNPTDKWHPARVARDTLRTVVRTGLRWLGSIPETTAVRHPFYNKVYRDSMTQQVATWGEDGLTDAVLRSMSYRAHSEALRELKSTIYTIERYSNAAHFMRFLSPFYAAWENTIKSWARIAAKDPSVAARGMILWNAPNEAGWVIDSQTGEKATADTPLGRQQLLISNIPQGFIDSIPDVGPFSALKQTLESHDSVGISKASMNVVLQGDPWWAPGFGPTIAVPVNMWTNADPESAVAAKAAELVLPFGPADRPLENAMPAWMKRWTTKFMGDDSQQYANAKTQIAQTEFYKFKIGLRDEAPTNAEIEDRTQSLLAIRMLAATTLPASVTFYSPYKPFIDDYRRMRKEFGSDADEKFYAKYGSDAFVFTSSQSRNETGVSAQVDTVRNLKENAGLVSVIDGIDPSLIGAIMNPTSEEYVFNAAAYNWQTGRKPGPGSAVAYRSPNNPAEAIQSANERKGWIEYSKLQDITAALLAQRGLTSLSQKGAADIQALRTAWIDKQREGDNYDWWRSYQERDSGKWADSIQAFTAAVSDEKWWAQNKDNPTWQSIRDYIAGRDAFVQIMESRGGDIDSKANADVKLVWDAWTAKLTGADPDFGRLFSRYFEGDKLKAVT